MIGGWKGAILLATTENCIASFLIHRPAQHTFRSEVQGSGATTTHSPQIRWPISLMRLSALASDIALPGEEYSEHSALSHSNTSKYNCLTPTPALISAMIVNTIWLLLIETSVGRFNLSTSSLNVPYRTDNIREAAAIVARVDRGRSRTQPLQWIMARVGWAWFIAVTVSGTVWASRGHRAGVLEQVNCCETLVGRGFHWCRGRESNPYAPCGAQDFKSHSCNPQSTALLDLPTRYLFSCFGFCW